MFLYTLAAVCIWLNDSRIKVHALAMCHEEPSLWARSSDNHWLILPSIQDIFCAFITIENLTMVSKWSSFEP
jgi:hypothetical protein